MSGKSDSGRPRRRHIGRAARVTFVTALRGGATRDAAAKQAGFTIAGFYYARRRDALFRLAWIWALEASAAEEREKYRASTLAGCTEGAEITPNNKRQLQRRRVRCVRFGAERKKLFLAHFAGTADVFASAEAAGVHVSTVYKHRREDPEFALGWDEALRESYALLEAEAVRQRLEAQKLLRERPEPTGEMAKEFERVMQLLARMDRRDGRIGTRTVSHGRQKRWSFDEAIALLDKKLRALGARYHIVPPEGPPGLPPPKGEEE